MKWMVQKQDERSEVSHRESKVLTFYLQTLSKNENLRKKKQSQEKTEHERQQEIAQKKKQDRLQAEV